MVQEKREGRFGGITTKQKVTVGAFLVVVLIIIWQVMGLFGSDTPTPTAAIQPVKPQATMNANSPSGTPGASSPVRPAPNAPNAPQINPAQPGLVEGQPRQAPIMLENQMLELQKKTEEKYVEQLNQLQMLKVQREIAETNQAIASARLATVTAEKNVSDLLTRPTPQPMAQQPTLPPPPASYGNALGTPAQTQPLPPIPTEGIQPPVAPQDYSVISVSMQLGRWSAVIGNQGKLYNVSIGDVLPDDGSIVSSIDKNGVVLTNKKGKRQRVSLVTSI
jgi:hypothetical protein